MNKIISLSNFATIINAKVRERVRLCAVCECVCASNSFASSRDLINFTKLFYSLLKCNLNKFAFFYIRKFLAL